MGQVNQPDDLLGRIKELERKVKELSRGQTLNGAVLSQGNLEVRDPDGHTTFKVGQFVVGSDNAWGWAAYRSDGSLQMQAWDAPGGVGYWAMYDEASNVIVSNDTVSNQGLATPYISSQATAWSRVLTPPELTTSASFATIYRIHMTKQHPRVRVKVVTKLDAGTTGEIRLAVGGVAISSTQTLPDADYSYRVLEGPIAGSHMAGVDVDVEARRLTGAGNVRVEVVTVEGKQS